jgi:hypothetical protein
MNTFADEMERLRQSAAGDKLMKTLERLDVLRGLADGERKKPRMRLPYSSDPRPFGEPWKQDS